MRIQLVLCWLMAVAAILVGGCATTEKERTARTEATAGAHPTKRMVLPPQKMERLPFLARKARYLERFTEKDLVPAMAVSDYLKVLEKDGRIPLRVREGFIVKEGRRWYLVEWSPGKLYVPQCMGPNRTYYVVDMKAIVCP